MQLNLGYMAKLGTITLDDQNCSWIQAVPVGKYEHELYGELDFDLPKIQRFADNINNKARGIDPDVDYDHKRYSGEAAGWIKAAEVRNGLMVQVEWTPRAAQSIKAGEYKYFSPELVEEWTHPKTGTKFTDVVLGGAVTNRPFLKDIMPLNLSEVMTPRGGEKVVKISDAMKPIAKALGLAEDVEEDVFTKKLTESLAKPAPSKTEPEPPKLPAALAEDPAFKAFLTQQTEMATQLAELGKQNKTLLAERQLDGLNTKDRALPPSVRELLSEGLVGGSVDKLLEGITKLSETGFVQLGETGAKTSGGDGNKTVIQKFADAVNAKMKDDPDKLSQSDAMVAVAAEQPELFAEYRKASYAAKEGS